MTLSSSRVLLMLLLVGCGKNVKHALIDITPQVHFQGVRTLTVVGNSDDIASFSRALSRVGIEAVPGGDFVLPGDLPRVQAQTAFVAGIHGLCSVPPSMGALALHVDVYDAQRGDRLFLATASEDSDCGGHFYKETAKALAAQWSQ